VSSRAADDDLVAGMEPCPVPLPVPANPPPADDRTRDAASVDDEVLAVDLLDCEVVPRIRP
jgi:hypothetical protein